MNIVCLILAHKNLWQLIRLVKLLVSYDINVVIHLDKKWNLTIDEINEIRKSGGGVYIIEQRLSTFLDHKSLVLATLELIKSAKRIFSPNYYILMSGQDYPIKDLNQLINKLKDEYPQPFIDCTPYSLDNWLYFKYKNSAFFNSLLVHLRMTGVGAIKKIERRLHKTHLGNHMFSIYRILKRYKVEIYGGSAWWVLPDIAINDMLIDIDKKPYISDCLLNSYTPEETYFQTMVMRTSVRDRVFVNNIYERKQNCLTYANFETPQKKFCGHPYIITEDDVQWLIERPEYIARKFDETVCSKVLDIIEHEILKYKM